MGLFKPDLYRSFVIGFVAGAAILGAVQGLKSESSIADGVIPAASAAPVLPDQTLVDPSAAQQR